MRRAAPPATTGSLAAVTARGGVVCIGNFDGVHLGHRRVLARMRELADAAGAPAIVVTFFPPARVLFEGATYLATPAEKLLALEGFAPDTVASLAFDRALAATPKAAWLAELAALRPRAVVVGEDFRFGHGREGGLADLRTITPQLEAVPLFELDGAPVRSTTIRGLLVAGDVTGAARLLGAPYLARGTVTSGQHRGRTIGYPTANLIVPHGKALPPGVFAVTVTVAGAVHSGMANVGARPTFAEAAPALEVHLFDFAADIYDVEVDVRFVTRLRDQRRFAGIDELKAQLAADEVAARAALAR